MNGSEGTFTTEQIRLERRLPSYWRVTFDIPPLNIFGPKEIPQLNEIITAIETDQHVKSLCSIAPSRASSLRITISRAARGFHTHSSGTDRATGAAGHAGASQPR